MITPREHLGYRELAALLREQITSGRLRPGARIPSEQDLRQAYGVARETARSAMRELAGEGLIVVRHGYPSRVAVPVERAEVLQELGSMLLSRRATPEERERLDLTVGAYVVVLSQPDGTSEVYAADRHIFRPV